MNDKSFLKQLYNVKKYPLTVIISVFLIAMLLGYVCGREYDFSDMENRYLQKMPAVSADSIIDGSFMESFETYTNEQIPFRNFYIKSKLMVDTALLKVENHGITRGKEGHLFDKSTASDDVFVKNLMGIDSFIKKLNRTVFVAFVPTSVDINSDMLLRGVPVIDETLMNNKAKQLLMDNRNARFIDLEPTLMEHRSEGLYYRTDHHWNIYGAYYGYREIIKAINDELYANGNCSGAQPENIKTLEEYKINTYDGFYGTFYAKYQAPNIMPDSIGYIDMPIKAYTIDNDIYDSIYDFSKLEIYDKYAMFMRGNYGSAVVDTKNDNGRELLILKDSYANSLIPYLCDNYGTIKIIDLRYYAGSIKELLSENDTADILMLYNYSFLNEDRHFYKLTQ